MNKKLKGYMTLEAAFVMPVVLVLYLLIILAGFYLYDRCVISQDNGLLAFRGSRFTAASENYGEVVYGDMETERWEKEYLLSRLEFKERFYPFYTPLGKAVSVQSGYVTVDTEGLHGLNITKRAERINPLESLRKERSQ